VGKDQAGLADVIDLGSPDIIAIGAAADDVRRRLHGVKTTFVRVFEVHLDAIPANCPSTLAAGEFRIAGRPTTLEDAVGAVTRVKALAGGLPVCAFALQDLGAFEGPLEVAAARLREAGLDAIAEVPVDIIVDAASIAAARRGGLVVDRLTVNGGGAIAGAAVVERAIALQRALGGFRVFAPLPRVVSVAAPTTGYDDVKTVAAARLMLEDVPSIQVDWALYGPKLAQVALTMGADDVYGVAAFDTASLGSRRSALAEIVGNIRAAGLEPVERNGRFELL
jgi:aminodeoxyfutalosine synthase